MRFDSKPDRGDEAYPERDGKLDLPDDLALMGEQLREDAQRLASSYPARSGPVADVAAAVVAASQARPARRRDLIVSMTVGGLVALSLLVMFTLGLGNFFNRTDRDAAPRPIAADPSAAALDSGDAAPSLASAAHSAPQSDSVAALPTELLTPAGFSGSLPAVTPALLTSGITGPEMEAWIDLRQDELEADRDSLEF
jgi:Na+-transporting methylmalonyl-CoA/oxaloacetate decarboxylase gamma subunit